MTGPEPAGSFLLCGKYPAAEIVLHHIRIGGFWGGVVGAIPLPFGEAFLAKIIANGLVGFGSNLLGQYLAADPCEEWNFSDAAIAGLLGGAGGAIGGGLARINENHS